MRQQKFKYQCHSVRPLFHANRTIYFASLTQNEKKKNREIHSTSKRTKLFISQFECILFDILNNILQLECRLPSDWVTQNRQQTNTKIFMLFTNFGWRRNASYTAATVGSKTKSNKNLTKLLVGNFFVRSFVYFQALEYCIFQIYLHCFIMFPLTLSEWNPITIRNQVAALCCNN